jgi:hypothetical protein
MQNELFGPDDEKQQYQRKIGSFTGSQKRRISINLDALFPPIRLTGKFRKGSVFYACRAERMWAGKIAKRLPPAPIWRPEIANLALKSPKFDSVKY